MPPLIQGQNLSRFFFSLDIFAPLKGGKSLICILKRLFFRNVIWCFNLHLLLHKRLLRRDRERRSVLFTYYDVFKCWKSRLFPPPQVSGIFITVLSSKPLICLYLRYTVKANI